MGDGVRGCLTIVIVLPALAVGFAFAVYLQLPGRFALVGRPLGIDRWAALVSIFVFLAGFGWISIRGDIPDEGERGYYLAAAAFAGIAVGLFGVALALGNIGRYRGMAAGNVSSGVADAVGEPTERAPISGDPCLAWAVRVREHTSVFRRGSAPTVFADSGGETFVVERPTEKIRIDPTDAALDVWSPIIGRAAGSTVSSGAGSLPDRVRTFAADNDLGDGGQTRVYEEVCLEPGDQVTVVGPSDSTLVRGGEETTIIDRDGDAVRRSVRRRMIAGPVGVALAVASFSVLGSVAGVF